jgi:cytochrome P450
VGEQRPVQDWATDFDHLSDEWAAHGPEILADLRERCPVAHTDRYHGAYLVTRYDDVMAVTHDPGTFSSRVIGVTETPPDAAKLSLGPLTLDPPDHGLLKRALLPTFNPHRVAELRPLVEGIVEDLLDGLAGADANDVVVDGAGGFAELVPMRLMSRLFGVPDDKGEDFRAWVDGIIRTGQRDIAVARAAHRAMISHLTGALAERLDQPPSEAADDLVQVVLDARITDADGTVRALTTEEQIGSLYVLMLGGIDTTWSLIGAALFHLGTHPADLARLVAAPELIPTAIEEFLRFYSPATVGRLITEDAGVGGCPVAGGQRLLLSFPSANRDPDHFDRPDEVVIDRLHNRHIAFGTGIHRCIGSNLARMETEVALRAWLRHFPRFELAVDPGAVDWSIGAVRGPYRVPLRILAA